MYKQLRRLSISMTNILKLNHVTQKVSNKPNYKINLDNREIRLYFTLGKNVIIIGQADNNYVYWISKTAINDFTVNCEIFDYITKCNYDYVCSFFDGFRKVIKKTGYSFQNLDNNYYTYIIHEINTSLPPYYCDFLTLQSDAKIFGEKVIEHYNKLKQECSQCEFKPETIHLLIDYSKKLRKTSNDPVKDYIDAKEIIQKLEQMQYLKLSNNLVVRKLFLYDISLANGLYNQYMTRIK